MEAIIGLDYSKSRQTSPEVSPAEAKSLLDSEFKTRMDRIGEAEFTPDIVQLRSPRRYKKVRSIRENTGGRLPSQPQPLMLIPIIRRPSLASIGYGPPSPLSPVPG